MKSFFKLLITIKSPRLNAKGFLMILQPEKIVRKTVSEKQ
jgi:hypothetical protein